MVYTPKTKVNNASITKYLDTLEDSEKREDSYKLLNIFTDMSWEEGKMWWDSIIGFWNYSYEWKSCKWEWMRTGFSPRKTGISIYIMPWYGMKMEEFLEKLWKHSIGKSCLKIKRLSDIDIEVLKKIIQKWLEIMDLHYPR